MNYYDQYFCWKHPLQKFFACLLCYYSNFSKTVHCIVKLKYGKPLAAQIFTIYAHLYQKYTIVCPKKVPVQDEMR